MRAQPQILLALVWASPTLAFRTGSGVLQPSRAYQRGISLRRSSSTSSNELLQGPATVPELPPLKNRYFALRHGQSTANVEGVISSLPAVGIASHGLTQLGIEQARSAAPQVIDKKLGCSNLLLKCHRARVSNQTGKQVVMACYTRLNVEELLRRPHNVSADRSKRLITVVFFFQRHIVVDHGGNRRLSRPFSLGGVCVGLYESARDRRRSPRSTPQLGRL